jgi:TM2 domain-containing membrane protein YozV
VFLSIKNSVFKRLHLIILVLVTIVLSSNTCFAKDTESIYCDTASCEVLEELNLNLDKQLNNLEDENRPFPILEKIKERRKKNKKITAAILAFPIPFGIVGLHRIYLGTAPYVPVAYVATLGGVLGILPFIDFCVLILDKEIDRYQNNKKVFMWVNQ